MQEDHLSELIENFIEAFKEADKYGLAGQSTMFLYDVEDEDGLLEMVNRLLLSRFEYLHERAIATNKPPPSYRKAMDLEEVGKMIEDLILEARRILE